MTITRIRTVGPCALGTLSVIRRREIASRQVWVARTTLKPKAPAPRWSLKDGERRSSALARCSRGLLKGSASAISINLAVAYVIRRPRGGRARMR